MEEKLELIKELYFIRQWLKNNDWKVNKYVLGEWKDDDPRWIEYLEERAIKRARQDEINNILEGDNNGTTNIN